MKITIYFAFLLIAINHYCESAKILMLFPSPSRSHLIITQAVTVELAKRGHNVTVVSSFPLDYKLVNYNDIYIKPFDNFQDSK